jgi:4-hydroxybenzoate polyprenyltransferase
MLVFWLWVSLLQTTVANQSVGTSPEEDAINKPFRPIPSKRISLEAARLFRWLLVPVHLALSVLFGAFLGGLGVSVTTAIHNEIGGSSHWFTKNGCCAIYYAAFEYGGTMIAGKAAHRLPFVNLLPT